MVTLPFTVGVFMVRAWVPGGGEETVGRMTGLLAASFSLAQTATAYGWGLWSSTYGRKPVMVIGSGVTAACLVWFGLSGSYAGACAARVVAGLLNGIICAWKCMIGESCDDLTQGKIMALMSLGWGIGCVAGPAIGGLLSQPCDSWPGAPLCGEAGLFRARPYLLPCLVVAACSAASCVWNALLLEETLPSLVARRRQQQQEQQQQQQQKEQQQEQKEQPQEKQQAVLGLLQAQSVSAGDVARRLAELWRGRRYSRLRADCAFGAGAGKSDRTDTVAGGQGLGRVDSAADFWLRRGGSGKSTGSLKGQGVYGRSAQGSSDSGSSSGTKVAAVGAAAEVEKGGRAGSSAGAAGLQLPCSCPAGGSLEMAALRVGRGDSGGDRGPDGHGDVSAAATASKRVERIDSGWLLQSYRQPSALAPVGGGSQCGSGIASSSGDGGGGDEDAAGGALGDQSPRQRAAGTGPCAGGGPRGGGGNGDVGDAQPSEASSPDQFADKESGRDGSGDERKRLLPDSPRALSCSPDGSSDRDSTDRGAPDGPWHRDRQVVLALLGYGAVCLLFCMLDEVMPIFASAPISEGGLAMEEADLAVPLALNGACLILFSLLGYPPLQRRFGALPLSRAGLLLSAAVCLALPLPSLAAAARGATSALPAGLLTAVLAAKAVVQCCAFTGSMILVNTLPHPSQLGAVNGVGQTLASLVRGLGPLCGGLAWGLAAHVAGGQFLVFGAVACVALAAAALFGFLRVPSPRDGGRLRADDPARGGTSCCEA